MNSADTQDEAEDCHGITLKLQDNRQSHIIIIIIVVIVIITVT